MEIDATQVLDLGYDEDDEVAVKKEVLVLFICMCKFTT